MDLGVEQRTARSMQANPHYIINSVQPSTFKVGFLFEVLRTLEPPLATRRGTRNHPCGLDNSVATMIPAMPPSPTANMMVSMNASDFVRFVSE